MPGNRHLDPGDLRPMIGASAEFSKDQFSSTLFLAGLFHGVILLGVTFSASDLTPETPATSLEVVLITNDYEDRLPSEDTELLAQQNMVGAGNTGEPLRLDTALNQTLESGKFGLEEVGAPDQHRRGTDQPQKRPTIVARSISSRVAIPENYSDDPSIVERQQKTLPGESQAIEIINQPAAETLISDFRPRELIISANTREARIAAYLGQWKNKVESVGTLNYPNMGRSKGLTKFPVLEVAINAQGELQDIIIRNSSGDHSLDRAAMDIVKMSAPFDQFPDFLRSEYEVLRFAYEWRFIDGYVSTSVETINPL
jgi:protein TonB